MKILLALDDKDHYIHNDLKKYLGNIGETTLVDLKEIRLPEDSIEKTISKAREEVQDSKKDVLEGLIGKFKHSELTEFLPSKLYGTEFDLAFVYTERSRVLLQALLIGEYLKKKGVRLYQDPKLVLDNSHDKWNVIQILKKHNIPVPETQLISLKDFKNNGGQFVEKYPQGIVVKSRIGGGGEQVLRVIKKSQLSAAADKISQTEFINYFKKPILIQPLYELKENADLRIVIIGEEFIGAFKRIADKGWKTNIAQGGRLQTYKPSSEELETCLKALESLNLKQAGLDLFPLKEGTIINEVNTNFGYKALMKITKSNPVKKIAEKVKSLIKS